MTGQHPLTLSLRLASSEQKVCLFFSFFSRFDLCAETAPASGRRVHEREKEAFICLRSLKCHSVPLKPLNATATKAVVIYGG